MNILIVGGSGFLGQHLVQHFCRLKHQVTSISRSPMASIAHNHRHFDITVDDTRGLQPLLSEQDFVFYLAWDTTPGSSKLQPGLEIINNLTPFSRFLEIMESCHANLVFVSSGGAIYNSTEDTPFSENSSTKPASFYGAAKLAAESFLEAYNHQTENSVVILRPSNIYGPGQLIKKNFGIIPTLFNCAKNGVDFQLWGSENSTRDYLYIEDFKRLCGSIISHDWQPKIFRCYNAGSGQDYSIAQLRKNIELVSERRIQTVLQNPRGIDLDRAALDCERAKQELQWHSTTSLEEGLRHTWRWICRL